MRRGLFASIAVLAVSGPATTSFQQFPARTERVGDRPHGRDRRAMTPPVAHQPDLSRGRFPCASRLTSWLAWPGLPRRPPDGVKPRASRIRPTSRRPTRCRLPTRQRRRRRAMHSADPGHDRGPGTAISRAAAGDRARHDRAGRADQSPDQRRLRARDRNEHHQHRQGLSNGGQLLRQHRAALADPVGHQQQPGGDSGRHELQRTDQHRRSVRCGHRLLRLHPNKGSNVLEITPVSISPRGGLVVSLEGAPKPLTFLLLSGGGRFDSSLSIHVADRGPHAKVEIMTQPGAPDTGAPFLTAMLDGVPPPMRPPFRSRASRRRGCGPGGWAAMSTCAPATPCCPPSGQPPRQRPARPCSPSRTPLSSCFPSMAAPCRPN